VIASAADRIVSGGDLDPLHAIDGDDRWELSKVGFSQRIDDSVDDVISRSGPRSPPIGVPFENGG
jgi:hypothetical protein